MFGALHIRVLFEILPSFSIPKMIPGSVPQVAAPSHLETQKLILLGGSLLLPAMLGLLIGFFWQPPITTALWMVSCVSALLTLCSLCLSLSAHFFRLVSLVLH